MIIDKLSKLPLSNVNGARMVMWNDVERLAIQDAKNRLWSRMLVSVGFAILFALLLFNS